MAFPDPIALKNAAASNVTFTRRNPIPNGMRYVALGTPSNVVTSTEIRSLIVSPKGGEKYTRNVVGFQTSVVDTDDITHIGGVSLSTRRPFGSDISDSHMSDLWAMLAEFLIADTGSYLTRFKRGEY